MHLIASASDTRPVMEETEASHYVQLSERQPNLQSRQHNGGGGVYARSERVHNFTMQHVKDRAVVAGAVTTNQRQQQQLQEQLPSVFPSTNEGENSEDGKRLHKVLAFQQPAAITAAAAAAAEKIGADPLGWRQTTVAMVAFGLSQCVPRGLKEDDSWRRAFFRNVVAEKCSPTSDAQYFLFMALLAEGSRRYEEADAYVLRMLVASAIRGEEPSAEQRLCMQRVTNRQLRHQRNLWKQTIALERALQTRQNAAEDTLSPPAHLERAVQLEEVLAYKQRLKADIVRHCYGVIWTATHLLKPFAVSVAGQLFVHKTLAAAYRQATQYTTSVAQFQCLELARENYEVAVGLSRANDTVELCDLTRLEVLISWVNFLFYNLNEPEAALKEGRQTLQEALQGLPSVKDDKKFKKAVEALQTFMRSIRRWMQQTRKDAVFDWWTG